MADGGPLRYRDSSFTETTREEVTRRELFNSRRRFIPSSYQLMAVRLTLMVLLVCMSRRVTAMQMAIGFGERKCFSEDLPVQRPILIDFRASAGQSDMDVDLFVTDSRGQVVFHKSGLSHHRATFHTPDGLNNDVDANSYGHAPRFATFRFCVMHQILQGQVKEAVERRIVFNVRSGSTKKENNDIAKFNDVDRANSHIRKLEEDILVLVDKMDVLREQERILTLKNESTSSFLTTVSSLTSLLVLGVGLLQFEMMQGVLKERKVIR